jgi:hypothetical protein
MNLDFDTKLALVITFPFLNISSSNLKLTLFFYFKGHDDVKFFRSRSHLMEICSFLYLDFYTMLDITLPFPNISSLNFQIYDNMLIMMLCSFGQGHI